VIEGDWHGPQTIVMEFESSDAAKAWSSRRRSSCAKLSSSTKALASRLSSSDSGSMLELPTVAQSSSTTATLACRKAGVYS